VPFPSPRVLVVGCGGLGGIVTATLLESQSKGSEGAVTALTTNDAIAAAVNEHGFRVRGVDGVKTVAGRAVTRMPEGSAPFDWIILATQPTQVEEAARSALPFLAADGTMVCLQNGLCEERIAPIVGAERVVGAVVAWGAAMTEPGVYDRTSSGGFTIGRFDGRDDERLTKLATLLEPVGPVTITRNLAGARWSKLAINSFISTLGTIGGDTLGALMLHRFVRRLGLEIMTEAVKVARKEKIQLEKVAGTIDLEWMALTDGERAASGSPGLLAKHSMLLAVGARYRRLRSSMLAAIERGRPPSVDFLNGELVARGKNHGVPTPFNTAAQETVHAIAAGKSKPSLATLQDLSRRLTT
jgi:2-dehydropantoate 2-reductase